MSGFSLLPDNEALSWFTISETGVLQTKAPFSAQNKRFDLKVVATDKGTPSLSSALPITIKIQGTEDDDGTPQWYNFVNNFVAQAPEVSFQLNKVHYLYFYFIVVWAGSCIM